MAVLEPRTKSVDPSLFRAMQKISVQALDADSSRRYSSTVLDWTDGVEMEIGVPTASGKEVRIAPGTPIALEIQASEAVIRYTSVVSRRVPSPLPSLVVEWPRGGETFQRRDDFRVPVFLPMTVTMPSEGKERDGRIAGTTADLSAGGARLITEALLPEGEIAEIEIEWPYKEPLRLPGRVIRNGEHTGAFGTVRYWAGVQFTELSPLQRRDLTRYLFDLQRELRNKNL